MRRIDDIITVVMVAIVFTFLGWGVFTLISTDGFSPATIKEAMPEVHGSLPDARMPVQITGVN